MHGIERGLPPSVDLPAEKALHDHLRALVRSGVLAACHDLSDGGLAVAAAEMCMDGIGAELDLPGSGSLDALLSARTTGACSSPTGPSIARPSAAPCSAVPAAIGLRLGSLDMGVDALAEAYFRTFETWLS